MTIQGRVWSRKYGSPMYTYVHTLSLLCLYFSVWLLSTIRWRSGMLIQRACRQETGIQGWLTIYNDETPACFQWEHIQLILVLFEHCALWDHTGICLLACFWSTIIESTWIKQMLKATAHCVDSSFIEIRDIQTELKSTIFSSECLVSHINRFTKRSAKCKNELETSWYVPLCIVHPEWLAYTF